MSEPSLSVRPETWSGGETLVARRLARPMVRFLAQETASGVLLLAATAAALIWVNSPFGESYHHFWDTHLTLNVGSNHLLDLSLHGWVNDVLMALFFFVVGLEIKSELVTGDLRNPRVAALPAIGALGGMVVPAVLYYFLNLGGATEGWGVPMATDIAFAVGVLALLGPRIPAPLKLFLLTLAIVDDIGAILVIALFYTTSISALWLGVAVVLLGVIAVLRLMRVWYIPVYALIGLVVWFATHESGIHATIAGVVLGLMAPARPLLGSRRGERMQDILAGDSVDPVSLRDLNFRLRERVAVTDRLIGLLSPWTSFVIVPLFALANAGVALSPSVAADAFGSPVTWGVIIGLVLGKPLGIFGFSMVALRAGVVSLPVGITPRHVLGAGAVAGIGFTVALFISDLAFADPTLAEASVIGILSASVLATLLGWAILRTTGEPTTAPGLVSMPTITGDVPLVTMPSPELQGSADRSSDLAHGHTAQKWGPRGVAPGSGPAGEENGNVPITYS